jgi:diadenosine tetraphosphate (Ap4A) HIT family hydrolase
MDKIMSFNGELVDFGKCMGCTIANSYGKDSMIAGQVLKTKNFNIAQDSELPINGFIVIGGNRHIENINEMTLDEKQELIILIDAVILGLKNLMVCPEYDVVWEEKEGSHFHVWIMPRHKYLLEAIGANIIKKVGDLFEYAKTNLRTQENISAIYDTIEKLKTNLKQNKNIKHLIVE